MLRIRNLITVRHQFMSMITGITSFIIKHTEVVKEVERSTKMAPIEKVFFCSLFFRYGYLSIFLSTYLSFYLLSIYLSIYLIAVPIYLSLCLPNYPDYAYAYLSI